MNEIQEMNRNAWVSGETDEIRASKGCQVWVLKCFRNAFQEQLHKAWAGHAQRILLASNLNSDTLSTVVKPACLPGIDVASQPALWVYISMPSAKRDSRRMQAAIDDTDDADDT